MKQLKKMALKEAVVLTDNEKKMVRGGDKKEKSCDMTCTGSCTVYIYNMYVNGTCDWNISTGSLVCGCKIYG